MKYLRIETVLLTVLLTAAFLFMSCAASIGDRTDSSPCPPVRYGLDIDISPAEGSGNYLCEARIYELTSGKVLSAPSINFDGTLASVRTGPTEEGILIELKVEVKNRGTMAVYDFTVRDTDNRILTDVEGVLALRKESWAVTE